MVMAMEGHTRVLSAQSLYDLLRFLAPTALRQSTRQDLVTWRIVSL